MNYVKILKFTTLFYLLFLMAPNSNYCIIIRHDVEDNAYLELAKKFVITSNIVYLNKTDVAGTLIKPNWILSAAHVAEELSVNDSLIHGKEKYKINIIIIHPGWTKDGPQDIALIRLEPKILDFHPVRIYDKRDETGKNVIVSGIGDFGTGKTGPLNNDGKLRAATNIIDEVSANWLKWKFDDPEKLPLKVSEFEGISGPGDSSGPAFLIEKEKTYIIGISSGQSTRETGGKEGIYGVTEYYTRVSSYIDWINYSLAQYNK